jgi:hypothetical protein
MSIETLRLGDATAIYLDGQLVATTIYSNAGQCWNVTDERTATHLGRHDSRETAEYHLDAIEWPYRQANENEGRAR